MCAVQSFNLYSDLNTKTSRSGRRPATPARPQRPCIAIAVADTGLADRFDPGDGGAVAACPDNVTCRAQPGRTDIRHSPHAMMTDSRSRPNLSAFAGSQPAEAPSIPPIEEIADGPRPEGRSPPPEPRPRLVSGQPQQHLAGQPHASPSLISAIRAFEAAARSADHSPESCDLRSRIGHQDCIGGERRRRQGTAFIDKGGP